MIKQVCLSVGLLCLVSTIISLPKYHQKNVIKHVKNGRIIIPASSLDNRDGYEHTNVEIYQSDSNSAAETPASLACIYGLVEKTEGCPKTSTIVAAGGSKTIAIVDAFGSPYAEQNLNDFSNAYGLPSCTVASGCLQIVYPDGQPTSHNSGWAIETNLDLQAAHAMAPSAKLILVVATGSSISKLMSAEDTAGTMVSDAGGGEVSNSWGGAEHAATASNQDKHFQSANVIYLASSGDTGGTISYPAVSAYVIGVGGTYILRSSSSLSGIQSWSNGGGGLSLYTVRPAFQSSVENMTGNFRGMPDIAMDAAPASGLQVYDADPDDVSVCDGTCTIGGTSLAAPLAAGFINASDPEASNTTDELQFIYNNNVNSPGYFRDITSGDNTYPALTGYDFDTGLGELINLKATGVGS